MKTIIVKENGTKTVSYEFTEKDLELLKKLLPVAPCQKCKDDAFCCGCPEYDAYKNLVLSYENNGIYDFAFTLRAMNSLKQQISELQEKYEEYENKLPVEIKNLIQKNTKEQEIVESQNDEKSLTF